MNNIKNIRKIKKYSLVSRWQLAEDEKGEWVRYKDVLEILFFGVEVEK